MIEKEIERHACYDLRYRILREPWGQPRGSEYDIDEDSAVLLGSFDETGKVIGTLRLQYNNDYEAQIRYMAVENEWRGKGVGKELDRYASELAAGSGHTLMILHAREPAVPFYKACGYTLRGKSYLLYDEIQHFLMDKTLVYKPI